MVVGDLLNKVCLTVMMLHLVLCPNLLFPSHILVLYLLPFSLKWCIVFVAWSSEIWSQQLYLFSNLGTNLKGIPPC